MANPTPYTRALRDVAECANSLAGWLDGSAHEGANEFTIQQATDHWSTRLTTAIKRLDSTWHETVVTSVDMQARNAGDEGTEK